VTQQFFFIAALQPIFITAIVPSAILTSASIHWSTS
jgi:hypothetical protein